MRVMDYLTPKTNAHMIPIATRAFALNQMIAAWRPAIFLDAIYVKVEHLEALGLQKVLINFLPAITIHLHEIRHCLKRQF